MQSRPFDVEQRKVRADMQTEQATHVLAFLLGAPRRANSWQLKSAAKQRLAAIQHALETYERLTFTSDAEALAQLNQAYRLLNAGPPAAKPDDLATRKHPLLMELDRPHPGPEMDAWKMFLDELRKVS
jgi:hypothetical protein